MTQVTRAHRRMGWRAALATVVACVLAGLASVSTAQPVSVRDDRGTVHRIAQPPQRIVSMLPSLTELAWALGAGPQLVGVDRFSNWPAALAHLPRLGGLEDAQIEAIAALKPDLILASTASRAMERLEALGFTVVRLKSETHGDVHRTMRVLSALLGTPQRGEQAWADLQRAIDAAAARVPAPLKGHTVYFEIGGGPYAAGASSFIGETLARLGLRNVVPAELGPFPKLNPEFIVRAQPEIVMGARLEQAQLGRRPGWSALRAVQQRRLCAFDAAPYEMMIRPGPRMAEAAGVIADCLARLDGHARTAP
jgi:iron complex transport system substrate-binding protein